MTYDVPVDFDAFCAVMVSVMLDDYHQLKKDFMKVFESKQGYVFSHDWAEDIQEISAKRVALREIILYYGGEIKDE